MGTEYQVDGETMRYADLVGVDGPDEADGRDRQWRRVTLQRIRPLIVLPSMEIQRPLIYAPDAFRHYLEGALKT